MAEVEIPTMEDFLERLYSLHPIGSAEIAYKETLLALGKTLHSGGVLTFDELVTRFTNYIYYIKPFNDIKDKQYIKKDKVMKNIGEYLMLSMYQDDYSTQVSSPNDNYLFGI